MRFNTLSLGLAATIFMAISVRAVPVGDVLENLGDNKVGDATSDIGNGGVRDATGDITDRVTDGGITDCILGDVLACLSENPKAAIAPIKRSVNLSRRKLFQRRAETGAVTDASKSNANIDAATESTATNEAQPVTDDEEDENEEEEDENELTRRKADEDEEDEDEEDEDDKGKRRKRSTVDGEDEEEVDEEEVDEEEVDEEEVEEEEEEADELGDAAPAGRR